MKGFPERTYLSPPYLLLFHVPAGMQQSLR